MRFLKYVLVGLCCGIMNAMADIPEVYQGIVSQLNHHNGTATLADFTKLLQNQNITPFENAQTIDEKSLQARATLLSLLANPQAVEAQDYYQKLPTASWDKIGQFTQQIGFLLSANGLVRGVEIAQLAILYHEIKQRVAMIKITFAPCETPPPVGQAFAQGFVELAKIDGFPFQNNPLNETEQQRWLKDLQAFANQPSLIPEIEASIVLKLQEIQLDSDLVVKNKQTQQTLLQSLQNASSADIQKASLSCFETEKKTLLQIAQQREDQAALQTSISSTITSFQSRLATLKTSVEVQKLIDELKINPLYVNNTSNFKDLLTAMESKLVNFQEIEKAQKITAAYLKLTSAGFVVDASFDQAIFDNALLEIQKDGVPLETMLQLFENLKKYPVENVIAQTAMTTLEKLVKIEIAKVNAITLAFFKEQKHPAYGDMTWYVNQGGASGFRAKTMELYNNGFTHPFKLSPVLDSILDDATLQILINYINTLSLDKLQTLTNFKDQFYSAFSPDIGTRFRQFTDAISTRQILLSPSSGGSSTPSCNGVIDPFTGECLIL
jgi:hypothetical protein